METKRKYKKPEVKSKTIKLGVFGEYNGEPTPGGDGQQPPVKILSDLEAFME